MYKDVVLSDSVGLATLLRDREESLLPLFLYTGP